MELALFDLDGTITTGDTTFTFISYYRGKHRFRAGMAVLMPVFILAWLDVIDHHQATNMTMTHFLRNSDRDELLRSASRFAGEIMPRMIRRPAIERIMWHRERDHHIAVVTGSLDILVEGWCASLGLEPICTKLDLGAQKISGRISGGHCYGREKADRIRARYDLGSYSKIHAYGDSRADKYMLELAHERHFRPFR